MTHLANTHRNCHIMNRDDKSPPKNTVISSAVVSAPQTPTSKHQIITADLQDTINKCTKRSNSCIENKYKCTITSDRLAQLRKNVEIAIRDHKIFSIKGGWPVIRRELLRRNWIEKYEPLTARSKSYNALTPLDDLTSNLPAKQDWESPTIYTEKCEKTIMSRMLQNHDVDLYWSMKKEPGDLKQRSNAHKLINRFSRSLFSSKEGLALLLQQSYWHTEPGVASVNFPRCYVLGFPDHYNLFVDDFRMTSCMGLLKWFVDAYETKPKSEFSSNEGQVPPSTVEFAIDRCNDYIASQKHIDIDKEFTRVWDHEWDQYLTNYHLVIHEHGLFLEIKEPISLYANAKTTLNEMIKYWPEYNIDGMRNIWILKPGNKCRGRGIQLIKNIADVDKVMGQKLKYVVQKYIEKPFIIYDTKFDIRQWFIVTSVQPLTIWMYRDSYLRFSSQIFSLNNFHESLHLTNHAVQCKYSNVQQRNKALPTDNMWDCHTFKTYLKQIGCLEKWNDIIYPGMKQSIVLAMLASQDTMDRRQNTYEIYGADFIVSEDFKPWLLEINCSPDLSFSTTVTSRLCPQCMEDIIKVVVDRRRDPKAHTGLFELIYKQNLPRIPAYLGLNLAVRGRKIFRNKPIRPKQLEKDKFREKLNLRLKHRDLVKPDFLKDNTITKILPKLLSKDVYQGPVIEDLIEELHKTYNCPDETGVDFVPVLSKESPHKKSDANKMDRVAKSSYKQHQTNKFHFVNRKENAKGGSDKTKTKQNCNNYFGILREWSLANKIPSKLSQTTRDDLWEKQTFSILKGKNILFNKELDVNKNYCATSFKLSNVLLPASDTKNNDIEL